jgi:hypothetical protein
LEEKALGPLADSRLVVPLELEIKPACCRLLKKAACLSNASSLADSEGERGADGISHVFRSSQVRLIWLNAGNRSFSRLGPSEGRRSSCKDVLCERPARNPPKARRTIVSHAPDCPQPPHAGTQRHPRKGADRPLSL